MRDLAPPNKQEEQLLLSIIKQLPKKDILKTGTLFSAGGKQCLDCLIWSMSDCEALLEVDLDSEIAVTGRLICEAAYIDRPYGLLWRSGRKIGVDFDP